MENKDKSNELIETIALEKVPEGQKKKWYNLAFIWAGSLICVPALMIGGMVGIGQKPSQAVLSMFVGYVIVIVYMTFLGIQSSDLGVPSVISVSRSFGKRGSSILFSVIIAISMMVWFSFQTVVCAQAFNNILKTYLNLTIPLWFSVIIWGVLMLITAVFGIKIINFLNIIAVPMLFIVLGLGVFKIFSVPETRNMVLNYVPENPISFIEGVTLTIGGFAVGAVLSGDYTRYSKNRKSTIIACIAGVIPAGMLVLIVGGMFAVSSGSYDITVSLASMGYPLLGLLTLVLATWTTNTGNAYSSALAVMNIFSIKDKHRAKVTLVVGILAIILALMNVIDYFVPFVNIVSAAIPAVAGVSIADYWVIGRGKSVDWKAYDGIRWIGIVSWLIGALAAIIFTDFFIPAFNSIVISFVAYLILFYTVKPAKKDLEGSNQNYVFKS